MKMTPQEFLLLSEYEIAEQLAAGAKVLRLNKGFTQKDFALKAGIAYATYSQFERTGKISLLGFLKVLRYLGRLKNISTLLDISDIESLGIKEYEKISKTATRQRFKKKKTNEE